MNDKSKAIKFNKLVLKIGYLIKIFVIIGLVFIILLPLYKMFMDTINASSPTDHYYLIPTRFSFSSYKRIYRVFFKEGLLYNSLLLATISATLQVIVCALGGFAFAKLKFKGSNIVFLILCIPLFFPMEGMYVQYMSLFREVSFFGFSFFHNKYSIYILYLFGFGIKTPIFIYLFKQTFMNLSNEVIEQARIDGCGFIQVFFRIALPLSMTAIVPTFLLTFVWQYNDYYLATFFGTAYDNFEVIATRLANGRMYNSNGTAFFMLVPILIIYIIVEKSLFNNLIQTKYSI